MELNIIIILILVILVLIFLSLYILKKNELESLKIDHEDLTFSHKSTLVKHGKTFEQIFPYITSYPYNPSNFRFIGTPIDGLSFEDDSVVFIEFKTGNSKLTSKQRKVKELIKNKKVYWKEIRN